MGLQVWLPLIEDLRNQGLAQSASFGTTTAFATNGKLGAKSLYSNAQKTATFSELNNVTNFSIAYWVKVDSSIAVSNYDDVIGLQCVVGDTTTIIRGEFSGAAGTHSLFIGKDSTVGGNTNTYYNITSDNNAAKDKWAHLAVVKDNSNVYTYVNGVLTKTTANSNFENSPQKLTGLIYLGNTTSTAAQINDFRIYDHCLTPEEVKRIAQGLVLHYPLNRNGWGQENLHKDSDTLVTGWTKQQATVSNGIVTISPTTTDNRRIYQMPADGGWTWQANTTYTASIWARSDNGGAFYFNPVGAQTSTSSIITATTEWKRYSYTFTSSSSPTTGSMSYFMSQSSGVTLQLKQPKLELGSKATPWCPNSSDTAYTTMGLNSTTEYDISGFCNNGTRTRTFSWTSDTPKYAVSTNFVSANSNNILVPRANHVPQASKSLTVSVWAYMDNWADFSNGSRIYSCTEGGGFNIGSGSSGAMHWAINAYTASDLSTFAYRNTNNITPSTLSAGWHMFTWVYTTTDRKVYIDGVLKSTITDTTYGIHMHDTAPLIVGGEANRSGATTPYFNGKMSDFRIYATALSADDVKSLYQNCATIGPDGTIYGKIRN